MARTPQRQSDLTDHDLLIRIDERVCELQKSLTSHKRYHWAVALVAISALVMVILRGMPSAMGGN